jgi:uncharacterized integral membrane protein
MIILFILGLLLGGLAVVFTLQNVAVVTVSLFNYHFTGPLSVILGLAVFSGILIALLIILPESINNYFRYRKLKKEITKLQEELKKQKELTVFAKTVPPTKEDIQKIEEGIIDSSEGSRIL